MARPLKYLPGEPFASLDAVAEHALAGGYFIVKKTGQRLHAGWVCSWPFTMVAKVIRERGLLRAIPNPEHPDHKETK